MGRAEIKRGHMISIACEMTGKSWRAWKAYCKRKGHDPYEFDTIRQYILNNKDDK